MSPLPRLDPTLYAALHGALALLFGWAVAHKLRDVAGFRAAFAAYDLLPRSWGSPAATSVIAAEIAIALGLLVPGAAAPAAVGGAVLLCIYSTAIAINLRRGRVDIDCGCMGIAGRRSLGSGLLVRNGVLILAALCGALPAGGRGLQWVDGLTIVASVSALALLYAAADGLIANASTRLLSFQDRPGEVR